jgi:predicted thioesterase
MDLKPGLRGQASIVVADEHTAPRVGSGRVRVLATPVMINLFEAAALAAIEHLLPQGYQSLGTHLDVHHVAATPVGMEVSASALVTRVDGRTVHFRLEAKDEKDVIGHGTHERMVVNVAKFDARVQAKLGVKGEDR